MLLAVYSCVLYSLIFSSFPYCYLQLTRGRILHDLEDLEESMAHVEDKHEDGLGGQTRGPKAVAAGSTAVQVGPPHTLSWVC